MVNLSKEDQTKVILFFCREVCQPVTVHKFMLSVVLRACKWEQ
jgi:hypothetical protein